MRAACHYAIVRFMPFVETEEFANVGVVVFAPVARWFGFRLLTQRVARVTNFFEQIEATTYRAAIRDFREELERLVTAFNLAGTDRRMRELDGSRAMMLWSELIRPRESMLRFGEGRVALTEDPRAKLQELFDFYVERNFVTREYREQVLERSVRNMLRTAHLIERYMPMQVGNDEYHARFPFVRVIEDHPARAIKPLYLGHRDSAKIIDHGGQWIVRVNALRKRGLLPDRVLFTVDGVDDDSARGRALHEIVGELRQLDVEVTPMADQQALIEFAAS
jgi:hypothetical protein